MAKYVLIWHKFNPVKFEETEAGRVDKEWRGLVAWGHLDVLRFDHEKAFMLKSDGKWTRVPKKAEQEAAAR